MSSTQDLCDAVAMLARARAEFEAAHPALVTDETWGQVCRALTFAQVMMSWKEDMPVADMIQQGGGNDGVTGLGDQWDMPRPGFGA